jgi:isoleucyl-tRNA synthetase
MKLKDTLCLPRTDLPMKASLPAKEPERLARWHAEDLYGRVRAARSGAPKFVLHDGPPYANGHVHLGTALNKILKDFVVKARSQAGFDSPFVPGWDCHGMPIEHAVLKQAREASESLTPAEIRSRCRAFALGFLDVQREEFKRLGILGNWADPYLTIDRAYEAAIVGAFGRLHEKGYIYKGLRSIHWCPSCQTALANAEIEHDPEHVSVAIHVRFPIERAGRAAELGLPEGAALLAWTTTPWTLPANVALAVHPDLEYALVGGDARSAIVASALLARVASEAGWSDAPVVRTFKGSALEGVAARHPLIDRASPVVLADYVTTDAGTGVVHTAPGHGADDFETGRRYGLPILVPVDKAGRFTAEGGRYAGRHVFEANAAVVEDLREAGALVRQGQVTHSYPTCWRCHGNVIFLATDQWFWRVDHDDLRRRCLAAVDEASWVPAWGHDRMHDSVQTRPDWCLSRQRAWGVPIPALRCAACAAAVLDAGILQRVEALVAEKGAEAWFDTPVSEIAAAGTACPHCGGTELEKDPDILDVWFDSSCSYRAVVRSGRWPEIHRDELPADLYLEAVDQHRGWFQVSLLNGVAIDGRAPFAQVFTHGLILDPKGRKMSKSLGNVVSPEEVMQVQGADVLRLFFASVDVTADIKFSKALIDPISEAYRKYRNTLRFLLGNLAGFDPARDGVPEESLLEIDRFALHRLRSVSADARRAYDRLSFHVVHRLLHAYLTTDVSAFLATVLKDRLYCDAAGGPRRRSAQTVLFEIARECTQLLSPVLCFTADEVWEQLPAWEGKPASVHEDRWHGLGPVDSAMLGEWEQVLRVRDEVLKALEVERAAGRIGDSLESSVVVSAEGDVLALLSRFGAVLEDVLAVSGCEVRALDASAPPAEGEHVAERLAVRVQVTRASGRKCPRCWRWRQDGGGLDALPDVCARCAEVVLALGVEIDAA